MLNISEKKCLISMWLGWGHVRSCNRAIHTIHSYSTHTVTRIVLPFYGFILHVVRLQKYIFYGYVIRKFTSCVSTYYTHAKRVINDSIGIIHIMVYTYVDYNYHASYTISCISIFIIYI